MTAVALVTAPQSAADRLADLEADVERGVVRAAGALFEVGRALAVIRDERLFLATHPDFKSYIENRFGFTQQWCYAAIYTAAVATAITESGGELHNGICPNAVRPLVPLMNREGAQSVAKAWVAVCARHSPAHRPPSRSEVRAVLVDHGYVTCAPEQPRVQLGPIGSGLLAAVERAQRLRAKLAGRLLPPAARARAAEYAALARRLADELEALADSGAAARRLAALEPSDADSLCVGHGMVRDADGLCVQCARPDLSASERCSDGRWHRKH